MPITREIVARKLVAYLHHEISLHTLVDWAQLAMMEEELEEGLSRCYTRRSGSSWPGRCANV